jgi:hypothetical protein
LSVVAADSPDWECFVAQVSAAVVVAPDEMVAAAVVVSVFVVLA